MSETEIILEPVEQVRVPLTRLRRELSEGALRERLTRLLGDVDVERLQISEPEVLGRDKDERSPFVAVAFDPDQNRSVELTGVVDDVASLQVRPSAVRPVPTPAELRAGLEILRQDERFAPLAGREDVVVYQPMPPLADVETEDGRSTRRPTLGILDPRNSPRHRIVAVDLGARVVDWEPIGVDRATDADCEAQLPVGVDSLEPDEGREQVRVRVLQDGVELWNLIVVRPRSSSPQTYGKGSGVELRHVHYRRRLVCWQAHVPILDVLYDDGTTYRDWQNQETPFLAEGSEPVGPGWRLCTQPPQTILESGTDAGNFQGVALWYEDGELRLVSEVQAGWYRYMSDWRLRDDGTILPRFGFAGTRNPRTCLRHQHHAYWRFDFDIEGAGRDVVQQRTFFGTRSWVPVVQETSRKRSALFHSYRVVDQDSGRGYRILPGLADGTADAYGVADLWFLRYHGNELDDKVSVVGGSPADTQVRLDQYLDGESIDGTDVVVWYAGHFVHDEHAPEAHQGHIVGPELRPVNW